jgi:hypothetical protein
MVCFRYIVINTLHRGDNKDDDDDDDDDDDNNNNNNVRKERHQGITEHSHIGHCTHTAESANVKVQNIFHGQNNITCGTNCKYRTPATLYTLATWFVSGI